MAMAGLVKIVQMKEDMDMLKQLKEEAEEDEDIYDKLYCWCETSEREKIKSIKEAEEKTDMLISKIEELAGSSARFGTEIKKPREGHRQVRRLARQGHDDPQGRAGRACW